MSKIYGYLLFFLPKIASSGSAIGSCMIISQVLMSEKNRSNKQQRIVCAMSFIDVIVSTVWFFTNLFIPSSVTEFPWSTGNEGSCTAQGFIVQFSISSVIYNAALSYYYLLVIKFNYRDRELEKIEKWIHICPLAFGMITAVTAFALRTYNFAVWDCWIAPPYGQNEGDKYTLARILQWCLFFIPLWIAIAFSSVNMCRIYLKVRSVERECARLNISRERQLMMVENTKSVATQGRLYVGAFLVTWMFPTISRIIEVSGGTIPGWLIVCSGTFIPSQGIFNALVYFRLRFKRCSEENYTRTKLWVVRRIIQLTLCPCWQSERYNMVDGRDVEPSFQASEERRISRSGSDSHSQTSSSQGRGGRLSEGWSGISFPSKNSDPSFVVSETSLTDLDDSENPDPVESNPVEREPRRYYQRARQICHSNASNNGPPSADNIEHGHASDKSKKTNDASEQSPQEQASTESERHSPAFLIKSFISELVTIEEGSALEHSDGEDGGESKSSLA